MLSFNIFINIKAINSDHQVPTENKALQERVFDSLIVWGLTTLTGLLVVAALWIVDLTVA